MSKRSLPLSRRQFLATSTTAPALLLAGAGSAVSADKPTDLPPRKKDGPIQESAPLPKVDPRIEFPTDALPSDIAPKRLAAITTAYWKYSHADDIITRFMEGYCVFGRTHQPNCKVVSLYIANTIDKSPDTDIGKPLAALYKIPVYKTITEALTQGGKELAVDGVLLIAEHGDYPRNNKGQILYPRKRFFEEIVTVFRDSNRSVPVYNDKHLSWSWEEASWMYDQSKVRRFPLMAGSSVPLAWRVPPLELRFGAKLEEAMAIGGGDPESSGFHVLEALQCFAERRPGGETGVKAVTCLKRDEVWKNAGTKPNEGLWNRTLLDEAIAAVPANLRRGKLEEVDKEPTVFVIEYTDGFRGHCYISPAHITEYAIALRVLGGEKKAATWFYLPKPQRDHFSFLCNHIEKMFLTDLASYPVERTLLTTGMLSFLMDSSFKGNAHRVKTPEISKISYRPRGE